MPEPTIDPKQVLDRSARLPDHVVFRNFAQETVVLNLDTGQYHGLNPTGGRMLEIVTKATSIRAAAAQLADDFPDVADRLETDLGSFCVALQRRGLIELVDP